MNPATHPPEDKLQPSHPAQQLARFAAGLRPSDIPAAVLRRTEDLMLDWVASVLAGKGARPVEAVTRFMQAMGPADGASELLVTRSRSSPLMAAAANAAASQVVEQDDVHNGAVFHPGAMVFPGALAVAQALGRSGAELLCAAVAGYEVGIRVGEFLGRSHYKTFHTTATAGTLAAAAAVGHMLRLDATQMLHAFGSAGTQSAGLWEFLREGADSRQLHGAHAVGAGLTAAYLARDGFTGAAHIFDGAQGMAAGLSRDADVTRLTDGLGMRWVLAETSFKFHASCRHAHPAADALQQVMHEHRLAPADLARVVARVHQGALDLLGPVTEPQSVQMAKFSMGSVLALIAVFDDAGVEHFDRHWNDARVVALRDKVEMVLDAEVEQVYPARWIGKVDVYTGDGRLLHGRVDAAKGDPDNTLTRTELQDKALRLAAYRGGASELEMRALIAKIWQIADAPQVGFLLAAT